MKQPNESPSRSTTDTLAVIVAWLVVGIPAAWGVSQVVIKSLALFR